MGAMGARHAPANPLAVLPTPYFINTLACNISEFIPGIPSSGRFVSSTYIFYSIRKSHGGFSCAGRWTPPECDLAMMEKEAFALA